MAEVSKAALHHRSNELNPNNEAYRLSRGESEALSPSTPSQVKLERLGRRRVARHKPKGAGAYGGLQ